MTTVIEANNNNDLDIDKRNKMAAEGAQAALSLYERALNVSKQLMLVDKDFDPPVERYNVDSYALTAEVIAEFRLLKDFEFRHDDVILAGFPKTGTSWTQHIIYLLMSDLDFAGAKKTTSHDRFPFLDNDREKTKDQLAAMPSPRMMKTLHQYDLLPPRIFTTGCKIVYVQRNPKDTVLSYYHMEKSFKRFGYNNDLETYVIKFVNDQLWPCPFWDHVFKYKQNQYQLNIHYMEYEQMKQDLLGEIKRLAKFLGKDYLSEDQLRQVADHCTFDKMKINPGCNRNDWIDMGWKSPDEKTKFMRKGKIGSWREELSPVDNAALDEYIQKNQLKMPLDFTYE